jgi:hypothetical protein
MFAGEKPPRAAKTGLYLIEYQYRTVPVAEPPDLPEVFV